MTRIAFTDKALRELILPEDATQAIFWDQKQPGLGYVLGRTGGTFVVSYYRDGHKIRETLGRRGEFTLPEARAAARAVVGRVAEDKPTPGDIRRAAQTGPTLAEATQEYLQGMRNRGCRPNSIETVEREMADPARAYVRAWLERPLRSITARECRDRHASIGFEHGKHVANRVMRQLGAIWNHVTRVQLLEDSTWPPNPTIAVEHFAGEQQGFVTRRREPIPWADLPTWRTKVETISPVRRDYHLFVLLTGMRRTDAATLRWEHVNLERETRAVAVWHPGKGTHDPVELPPMSLIRPVPKGGRRRAFVVPLSPAIAEVLTRRRVENQAMHRDDGGWVFPTRSVKARRCAACADLGAPAHAVGQVAHIMEPKELRVGLPSPHRLRDTYLTATEEAGVPEGAAKVLVNHAWGKGDVTAGYRKQDLGALRRYQEQVSEFLLSRMSG